MKDKKRGIVVFHLLIGFGLGSAVGSVGEGSVVSKQECRFIVNFEWLKSL